MPVQRPPEWEPEPLRLPAEPPVRRAPSKVEVDFDPDVDADVDPDVVPARSGGRQGSHVIVIDIA